MIQHIISLIQKKGWRSLFQTIRIRMFGDSFLYERWKKARAAKPRAYAMQNRPQVYILIESNAEKQLKRTVDAIHSQTYPNIQYAVMGEEDKIQDGFVMLLCAGDVLEQDAVEAMVSALDGAAAVYCDHDIDNHRPAFLPDYSIDYLRSLPYISRGLMIDWRYVEKTDMDSADDLCYHLALKLFETQAEVKHVTDVLLHAGSPSLITDRKHQILQAHLARLGLMAAVTKQKHYFHVEYRSAGDGVTIIIPNKDHREDLSTCIQAIQACEHTAYEILIVENGSTTDEIFSYYEKLEQDPHIRILTWTKGFHFSAIHNDAIPQAKYEHVLLMNNDVQILQKDFLHRMLGYFQRKEVGAVGVKLLYPDRTIQHDGVLLHICGYPAHAFLKQPEHVPGYGFRAQAQSNLSAVTAACMMTTKSAYARVNGMDEALAVAFNDIDYCLRLREAGYLIVQDPSLVGIHYESKSRGLDQKDEKKKERLKEEYAYFRKRWHYDVEQDPYYHPCLSDSRTDFRMKEVKV